MKSIEKADVVKQFVDISIECAQWCLENMGIMSNDKMVDFKNVQFKDTYCILHFRNIEMIEYFPSDIYHSIQLARFEGYLTILGNMITDLNKEV
jgi:hypothetical protein